MKKLLIYCLGLILFFANCEDNKNKAVNERKASSKTEIDSSKVISQEQQKFEEKPKDTIKITDENVVEFLTAYGKENPEDKVAIHTRFGDIEIQLFKDTPLHRANFIYLVKHHYFDDTFFHRVVPNFIIQGGNSDLVSTPKKRTKIGPNYRLPAEIVAGRVHQYGTVSGAKEYRENPDNKSAPYEFFIFLGPKSSTTHLNGKYTIFGKVTKGMDVVEEISKVEADGEDWPLNNIYISAKIVK